MTLLIYDIKYELIGYIFVNSFIFLFLRFNKLLNPHFFLWVEDVVEWPAFPVPAVRNWHAAGLGHSYCSIVRAAGRGDCQCVHMSVRVYIRHAATSSTPDDS